MTKTQFYWLCQKQVSYLRDTSAGLRARADQLERQIEDSLGIEYKDRGPGFNCWTHKDIPGWKEHPASVCEELDRLEAKKREPLEYAI